MHGDCRSSAPGAHPRLANAEIAGLFSGWAGCNGQFAQQCSKASLQRSHLVIRQVADSALQCTYRATSSGLNGLPAGRGQMQLHRALVCRSALAFHPATFSQPFQYMTYRGALHPECGSQPGGGQARFTGDARQCAMHGNGGARLLLELTVARAHAIDKRPRSKQCPPLANASRIRGISAGGATHDVEY